MYLKKIVFISLSIILLIQGFAYSSNNKGISKSHATNPSISRDPAWFFCREDRGEVENSLTYRDTYNNVFSLQKLSFGDKIKLIKGESRLKYNDPRAAYNIVYEVYQKNDKDTKVNYLMGQCLIASEEYTKAVKYLEISVQSNAPISRKAHLHLGIAYHRSGQIDKAISEFEKYKKLISPSRAKNDNIDKYIAQCNLAKEQMSNPQPVKIVTLGSGVNSKYPDYSPSVTADGKILIFTSRRPDTKGKKMDESDFMFYEDIYISRWNDTSHTWSTAVNNFEGALNTKFHDANLSISANGKQILVYRNVPGETKSGDIYYSDLGNGGKWSAPKPFGSAINTSYFESSACLTPDGKTLYFVSERKGGYGRADIYMSHKISTTEWGEAQNIGSNINTEGDEISLFLHPDGKTLYFSTNGRNGLGGYDIYKTTNEDGQWIQPVNIGYPINTLGDDLYFTITSDNVAYYVSDQESGLGAEDIYQVQFLKQNMELDKMKEAPSAVIEQEMASMKKSVIIEMPIIAKQPEVIKPEVEVKETIQANEQVVQPAALEENKKVVATNTNVFETKYIPFEVKSSDVKMNDQQVSELNTIIEYLVAHPSVKIQVSSNGLGGSYQRILAQNRSWNIADYFRQNGVEYLNVIIDTNDKGTNRVAVKILK